MTQSPIALGPLSLSRRLLARPGLQVFGANMLRAATGFLIGLLVARLLGPADFGLFTTFTVAAIWAQNLVGEGFDAGVVRQYARDRHGTGEQGGAVLGAALLMRALLALPVILLFWAVAHTWFEADAASAIVIGGLNSVASSLTTLSLSVLQARQRFGAYALLLPLTNAVRMFSLPLLWLTGLLSLQSLIWTQVLAFGVSAAVGLALLHTDLRRLTFRLGTLRSLFSFGKWTALANLCFLLQAYLAVPVLTYFQGAAVAGIYAAAATLLLIVDQLTISLLTVKLPATSTIDSRRGLRRFVRNLAPRLLAVAAVLCGLLPLAGIVVHAVYGAAYADSAAVVRALLPGFIATLVSHPLYLVLYALGRPQAYAASGLASLLLWCVLGLWLVPVHGVLGAAWVTTAARCLQAALILFSVWQAIGRPLPSTANAPSGA